LAGATSGACSTILFQPLDVVKTRLQESAVNHPHLKYYFKKEFKVYHLLKLLFLNHSRQMLPTFTHLAFKHGFTSLWAGLTPVILNNLLKNLSSYYHNSNIFSKSLYGDVFQELQSISLH